MSEGERLYLNYVFPFDSLAAPLAVRFFTLESGPSPEAAAAAGD